MKDFNFYAPTEVVFGKQSEEQVATLVKKYGAQVQSRLYKNLRMPEGAEGRGYGGNLQNGQRIKKHVITIFRENLCDFRGFFVPLQPKM